MNVVPPIRPVQNFTLTAIRNISVPRRIRLSEPHSLPILRVYSLPTLRTLKSRFLLVGLATTVLASLTLAQGLDRNLDRTRRGAHD